eukprot:TRINITY_DN8849_c0_g1_i4.p1 TRINITY_DN8849_c0_g1~~TRINITY_DN8849_c0_g1_i4.p1  ORF type:complete len:251 (+),score=49.91 TRINITY_DN8849_c0_g1_i4:80-832(+)
MEVGFGPFSEDLQDEVYLGGGHCMFHDASFAQDVTPDCSYAQQPGMTLSVKHDSTAFRGKAFMPLMPTSTLSKEFGDVLSATSRPGSFYEGAFGSPEDLADSTPFEACGSPRSSEKPRSPQVSTFAMVSRAVQQILPIKHTFIHFSSVAEFLGRCSDASKDESLDRKHLTRSSSSPAVLQAVRQVHDPSSCKPCSYYHYKVDGCRQGDLCQFCHLCPKGTLKKQKKEKKRMLRAAAFEAGAARVDSFRRT